MGVLVGGLAVNWFWSTVDVPAVSQSKIDAGKRPLPPPSYGPVGKEIGGNRKARERRRGRPFARVIAPVPGGTNRTLRR